MGLEKSGHPGFGSSPQALLEQRLPSHRYSSTIRAPPFDVVEIRGSIPVSGTEDMRMVSRLFRKQLRPKGFAGSNPVSSAGEHKGVTVPNVIASHKGRKAVRSAASDLVSSPGLGWKYP
jgi:hypothetical protein